MITTEVRTELITNVEDRISNTPTGDLRNLLCDINIVLRQDTEREILIENLTKSIGKAILVLKPDIITFLYEHGNPHTQDITKSR